MLRRSKEEELELVRALEGAIEELEAEISHLRMMLNRTNEKNKKH